MGKREETFPLTDLEERVQALEAKVAEFSLLQQRVDSLGAAVEKMTPEEWLKSFEQQLSSLESAKHKKLKDRVSALEERIGGVNR